MSGNGKKRALCSGIFHSPGGLTEAIGMLQSSGSAQVCRVALTGIVLSSGDHSSESQQQDVVQAGHQHRHNHAQRRFHVQARREQHPPQPVAEAQRHGRRRHPGAQHGDVPAGQQLVHPTPQQQRPDDHHRQRQRDARGLRQVVPAWQHDELDRQVRRHKVAARGLTRDHRARPFRRTGSFHIPVLHRVQGSRTVQ